MHKKQHDPESVRRTRVRQLFTARHPERPTETMYFFFLNGFNSIT
jgi:hypothetical protein